MLIIIWLLCGFLNFLLLAKATNIKEVDDDVKSMFCICLIFGALGFAVVIGVCFVDGYFINDSMKRWLEKILRIINKEDI